MTSTIPRRVLLPAAVIAGGLSLAGCTGAPDPSSSATPAAPVATSTPSPTPSASVTDEEALAVVGTYLSAILEERYDEAYAQLSPESQSIVGTAAQFTQSIAAGIVRADDASGFLGVDGQIVTSPGPEPDTILVTAVHDRVADAWLVRATPDGPRIDDAPVPLTGETPYEWTNPAAGPEDVQESEPFDTSRPAEVSFTDIAQLTGAEGPSLVGFPDEVFAYVGTEPVPATAEEAEARREWRMDVDPASLDAGTVPLTVVWEVEPGSAQWRTTTVALYLG